MEIGETWAYRARSVDALTPVRVLREGTHKPARVLVRFEDSAFEGKEEWVPPVRLKVLWSGVDAFTAEEARWRAVSELSPGRDIAELDAAAVVFDEVVPGDLAEIGWREGHLQVKDVEALAALLGLPARKVTAHPTSFADDDGAWIVPWPTTVMVAMRAAARLPERILQHVDKEERQAQFEAVHGHAYRSGRGGRGFIEPERCVEYDNESGRPVRELLRSWCGESATSRFDELCELRREIRRVGSVAEDAIAVLRRAGHLQDADRLARELGTPVEMLRHDRSES